VGEVVVEDLIDGVHVRQRDKLVVLGDILPVVNEHRLKMVGHGQLDGGPVVEVVLLRLVSISPRLAGKKSQKKTK
jgi:hypothetical protein